MKIQKLIYFIKGIMLVFMIIAAENSNCQTNTTLSNINSISCPSPNNSFLNGIGGGSQVSVDLYTGSAQVGISICALHSRQLTMPVSLNYVGSRGIKVQDYATCVGLGWQLSAGGNITRVVRGYPDESTNGYLAGGWGTLLANNWTVTNGIASGGIGNLTPTQVTALKGLTSQGIPTTPTADAEPDLYYVNTPFFSVGFVMDATGNPVSSNNNGLTINFSANKFSITDDEGTQYFFGSLPTSTETSSAKFYGTAISYISTWYLDKMLTYNSADTINITYRASTLNESLSHYQYSKSINSFLDSLRDATPLVTTISNPKYVAAISCSTGEVDFVYANDRTDDVAALRLSSIVLKAYNPISQSNSTVLKTYSLSQTYFGSPVNDPNVARLRFDYIAVVGSTTSTTAPLAMAQCTYNLTNSLPSRLSNSFDYWGYCSQPPPIDPTMGVALSRPPDPVMATAYILNTIKEATGSQWELTYELNDYYNGSSSVQVGGLRVHKLAHTLPTGENLNSTYSYVDVSGHSTGVILNNNYQYLGVTCSSSAFLAFSEAPALANDIDGVFVGYLSVKVINQNGGYTISNFTNSSMAGFRDTLGQRFGNGNNLPTVSSSVSCAYKRGLLLNRYIYTTAGALISETDNTYAGQTSPLTQTAFGYRSANWAAFPNGTGGYAPFAYGIYYTQIENYRLIKTDQYDHDQVTPANSIHRTTSYTYSTKNFFLVQSVVTNDSKLQVYNKTVYYPDNLTTIPMLPGPEYNAVNGLLTAKVIGPLIHSVDTRNGAVKQLHNTYSIAFNGISNNIFLTTQSSYVGSVLQTQTSYLYDPLTCNLVSSSVLGGKSSSIQYGYHAAYPVAKVDNAYSNITATLQQNTTYNYFNFPSGSIPFTISGTAPGSITIGIGFGSYPGATNITTANYSITGPQNQSGFLCYTQTGTGCSNPSSITFSSLPLGNYTLTASGSTNFPSSNPNISYHYTSQVPVVTYQNEFFYEGFEENMSAITGSAHTGNRYLNANYTTSFAPPNTRKYTIQNWALISGKWVFYEGPYTQGMVISGPVDDIRIFPTDGLMTSYTYNPLVGKTSEIDPSGKTSTYEYDGLQRINLLRDQDRNILKKYCYDYTGQVDACPLSSIVTTSTNNSSTTWTVTLTNVLTNQIYNYTISNAVHPPGSVTIPVGNYNLAMTPGNNSTHTVTFEGYTMSGSTVSAFSLLNISIMDGNPIFNITN